MHLTGASRKEHTSSGVSARCSGTIAVAHSPGDLRQRTHLMQFPIVLVAEGDVDVAVAGDDLRGVRWQAVHDSIGDKDSSKVVRRVMQGAAIGGVLQAGVDKSGVEHGPQRAVADRPDLGGKATLEQDRSRWPPDAFVAVV